MLFVLLLFDVRCSCLFVVGCELLLLFLLVVCCLFLVFWFDAVSCLLCFHCGSLFVISGCALSKSCWLLVLCDIYCLITDVCYSVFVA